MNREELLAKCPALAALREAHGAAIEALADDEGCDAEERASDRNGAERAVDVAIDEVLAVVNAGEADSEGEFLAECASKCQNCQDCGQPVPCGGCTAGGVCDAICRCDAIADAEDHPW